MKPATDQKLSTMKGDSNMNTLSKREHDSVSDIFKLGVKVGFEKMVAVGKLVLDSQGLTASEIKGVFDELSSNGRYKDIENAV